MHILVPRLGLVLLAQSVECFVAFFAAGLDHALAGARQLQRLGSVRGGVMMEIHVQRDTFLIFFEHRDCQAETHDREIHRCAVRRQRYHPPAFAAALIADAS